LPERYAQIRNPHNLLQDMAEEADLYAKAGDLVKLLNSWRAPSVKKLPELIVDQAQLMADTEFWQQASPPVQHFPSTIYLFPSIFEFATLSAHAVHWSLIRRPDRGQTVRRPRLEYRNASRPQLMTSWR